MSFAYMKILESRPSRYDVAMNLLMLGRLNDIKEHIASFTQAGIKCWTLDVENVEPAHLRGCLTSHGRTRQELST
jgi:hypothetical protein